MNVVVDTQVYLERIIHSESTHDGADIAKHHIQRLAITTQGAKGYVQYITHRYSTSPRSVLNSDPLDWRVKRKGASDMRPGSRGVVRESP